MEESSSSITTASLEKNEKEDEAKDEERCNKGRGRIKGRSEVKCPADDDEEEEEIHEEGK